MRYVILVMAVTLFILWESIYGDWIVTRTVVGEISRVLGRLGL
jgi:hypothetical protein